MVAFDYDVVIIGSGLVEALPRFAPLRNVQQGACRCLFRQPGCRVRRALSAFLSMRRRLLGLAIGCWAAPPKLRTRLRTSGCAGQMTDRRVVRDAAAFLATTATRLAINVMQSARVQRETDVGQFVRAA